MAAVVCTRCWRTAFGGSTRLSVEDHGRKYLLKLLRSFVVWRCVGERLMEIRHF